MTDHTNPPEVPPVARSTPGKPSDHQRPSRRTQMVHAARYAAQVLDRAAAGAQIDPAELALAAEGLRAAATRLGAAKPPARKSGGLPRRGRLTNAGRDVTTEDRATVAAFLETLAETEGGR